VTVQPSGPKGRWSDQALFLHQSACPPQQRVVASHQNTDVVQANADAQREGHIRAGCDSSIAQGPGCGRLVPSEDGMPQHVRETRSRVYGLWQPSRQTADGSVL
jgi:hypothetical protein